MTATSTAARKSPWATVRTFADYKRVLREQTEAGVVYSPLARERAASHSTGTLRLLGTSLDRQKTGQATELDLERIRDAEAGKYAEIFDPAVYEPEPEVKLTAAERYEELRARAVSGERVSSEALFAAQNAAEAEALAVEVAAERNAAEAAELAKIVRRQNRAEAEIVAGLEALTRDEVNRTARAVREALEEHQAAVRGYNAELAALREKVSAVYPEKPMWEPHSQPGAREDRHVLRGTGTLHWDDVNYSPLTALQVR